MNTTSTAQSRRVILAGISEERLDLFLLLNEGAGYEVTGVIDVRGAGESSRIAEILGVPVLTSEYEEPLPDADLLIYGDDRFLAMGERLHLGAESVWHENDAWRFLTEGDATPHGENGDAEAGDEAVARAASDWQRTEEPEGAKEPPIEPHDAWQAPATGESSRANAYVGSEDDAPGAREAHRTPNVTPLGGAPTGAPVGPRQPAPDGPFALLHAFAEASHDVETLYRWILQRAMEMSGAAAGGIRPHEAVRPYVWVDRRRSGVGELPAFLRRDIEDPDTLSLALGDAATAGGGSIHLVGRTEASVTGQIDEFLAAVEPALRTVAELDDHRRERAWEGIVQRLVEELHDQTTESVGDAIAETCRSLAETLGARECVLLFRSHDGEVVRGYSSNGQRIVAPARSGLFGGDGGDRPRRLVDEQGLWHYHVPFARDARRGALALFGVAASPGSVEAIGHQAVSLAHALAQRIPEGAWQA